MLQISDFFSIILLTVLFFITSFFLCIFIFLLELSLQFFFLTILTHFLYTFRKATNLKTEAKLFFWKARFPSTHLLLLLFLIPCRCCKFLIKCCSPNRTVYNRSVYLFIYYSLHLIHFIFYFSYP